MCGLSKKALGRFHNCLGKRRVRVNALDDISRDSRHFDRQYAFNLFSHDSEIGPEGYNTEEMKMVHETHKIWNEPSVRLTATCVRVPSGLHETFPGPVRTG